MQKLAEISGLRLKIDHASEASGRTQAIIEPKTLEYQRLRRNQHIIWLRGTLPDDHNAIRNFDLSGLIAATLEDDGTEFDSPRTLADYLLDKFNGTQPPGWPDLSAMADPAGIKQPTEVKTYLKFNRTLLGIRYRDRFGEVTQGHILCHRLDVFISKNKETQYLFIARDWTPTGADAISKSFRLDRILTAWQADTGEIFETPEEMLDWLQDIASTKHKEFRPPVGKFSQWPKETDTELLAMPVATVGQARSKNNARNIRHSVEVQFFDAKNLACIVVGSLLTIETYITAGGSQYLRIKVKPDDKSALRTIQVAKITGLYHGETGEAVADIPAFLNHFAENPDTGLVPIDWDNCTPVHFYERLTREHFDSNYCLKDWAFRIERGHLAALDTIWNEPFTTFAAPNGSKQKKWGKAHYKRGHPRVCNFSVGDSFHAPPSAPERWDDQKKWMTHHIKIKAATVDQWDPDRPGGLVHGAVTFQLDHYKDGAVIKSETRTCSQTAFAELLQHGIPTAPAA